MGLFMKVKYFFKRLVCLDFKCVDKLTKKLKSLKAKRKSAK